VRRGLLLASLLFVAVLGSRAPFAAHTLWAHDSVLYAGAIERGFHVDDDPLRQRPHPPGYILYVASADVAYAGGLGSNEALIAISALASALSAAAIFLFARRWVRDAVALVAAAAFAANPLVWQYSEIAYPYAVLGLGSLAVAIALRVARGRGLAPMLLASVAFAIAGGFRQDLLVLLSPLWLWAVAPLGWRRAAVACAAAALGGLLWLVPTVVLSGGIDEYAQALASQASYVGEAYSVAAQGAPAFIANLSATTWAVGWGLFAMAPLTVAALVGLRRRRDADAIFLALWTLPALALYVVLHIGDWGYALSALPGLYIAGARVLERVIASLAATQRAPAIGAAWASLVVAPGLVFVLGSGPFSATAIARHDGALAARVAYVKANYAPRTTLILTREDHLLVRYYLPEYRARQYDPEPFTHASRRMRTSRVERVVVFTEGLTPERAGDVRRVQCSKGIELVYLDVAPGSVLEFRGERYAIASPPP